MASKEQCDLLLADRSTLSVRKALALMWERRNEKNVIAEIIDIIWLDIFPRCYCATVFVSSIFYQLKICMFKIILTSYICSK